MVLVDSSVWIDHLHRSSPSLIALLNNADVLVHPMVIGEIAMGSLKDRNRVLRDLRKLPTAQLARDTEVWSFIEAKSLHGLGIGYIDAHLLASARLTLNTTLWTRDKRLDSISGVLGLRYPQLP
jgi:predicted nucleic acid-binding protein